MKFRSRLLTMALSHRALRWATVIALLCCAAPAQAQTAGADTAAVKEAKALFQQARAAMKQGDLAQALVLFRKSYRRHQAVGTLLNMASCEEQLGRSASAWLHYQWLTAQLPANDERLPLVKEREAALEPRVGWLEIKLTPGAPSGTRVTRDDIELTQENLGAVLPVDPISHVIVVRAPGRKERRYELTVAEGKRDNVTVEPGEASAPLTKAPSTGSPARIAGFIVGGVGIASLSVGAATVILALTKKNEVAKVNTGEALAAASTFAAGLATLGVGTYLVLSNREKPTATAAFAPLWLPNGAGLGASGTF